MTKHLTQAKLDSNPVQVSLTRISSRLMAAIVLAVVLLAGSAANAQMFGMPGQNDDKQREKDLKLIEPVIRAFKIGELEAMPVTKLETMFKTESENLKQAIGDLRREAALFYHSTSDVSRKHSKLWKQHVTTGKATFQRLKEITLVLFLKKKKPEEDLYKLARMMMVKSFDEGRIDKCYQVAKKLAKMFPEIEEFNQDYSRFAAFNNEFDTAIKFLESNRAKVREFPILELSLFSDLDAQKAAWEAELAIRKKEAEADDLPRVEIETNKGTIIIELFENEAPHSVGNFVSLIEAGFYDELIFHSVVRNYRAQGGIFSLKEPRSTGYDVVDESTAKNARQPFRGSVSMVSPLITKGASEFFISLSPEIYLPNKARPTVIGRVIDGIEAVESLNITSKLGDRGPEYIEGCQPDRIISTRVIRKRPGTEYVPKIVEK